MKLLVVAICAFSSISYNKASEALEKLNAEFRNIAKECAKETGTTDDEFNNFLERRSAPESHAGQCMLLCVGQHMGALDDDGKFIEAGARAFYEPIKYSDGAIYNKMFVFAEKCKKFCTGTGTDHCITTVNFFQCTLDAEKEMMD